MSKAMSSFNSILVRLKAAIERSDGVLRACFNSILVRLKGFMKAASILYTILMSRVNFFFTIAVFKGALLSTSGSAQLLGG